jgi:hypothetical protein
MTKIIKKESRKINQSHKEGQLAQDSHYETIVDEPSIIYCDDKLVAGYFKPNWDMEPLRNTLSEIKYTGTQTQGIRVTNCQFGTHAGGPLHFTKKNPEAQSVLAEYSRGLCEIYQLVFPDRYKAHHIAAKEEIIDEAFLSDSLFTNGVINHTNALPYHFDVGNYPQAMTCVYSFSTDVHGGNLVFPLINLAIKPDDASVMIFDGLHLLHGVTPIRQLSDNAYRFTVVYYTLRTVIKWRGESGSMQPLP